MKNVSIIYLTKTKLKIAALVFLGFKLMFTLIRDFRHSLTDYKAEQPYQV